MSRRGKRRLLFVCTGNTCRSPIAEALARAEARARKRAGEVEVRSAGTFGREGEPVSEMAEIVARGHGLDLGRHRSTPLTPDLLEWADLVLAMGEGHLRVVRELAPGARAELVTRYLPPDHPYHDRPVADPIGGMLEEYETAFAILEEAVRGVFDRLSQS